MKLEILLVRRGKKFIFFQLEQCNFRGGDKQQIHLNLNLQKKKKKLKIEISRKNDFFIYLKYLKRQKNYKELQKKSTVSPMILNSKQVSATTIFQANNKGNKEKDKATTNFTTKFLQIDEIMNVIGVTSTT